MSWMDSWSRPGKPQATPAPYYLLPGREETPYCKSCGCVVSTRKTNAAAPRHGTGPKGATPSRYCSARCRNKPGRIDREIEVAFARMLEGQEEDGNGKGDPRILVSCEKVKRRVFGYRDDPEKTFGRKKNRASRALPTSTEDDDNDGNSHAEKADSGADGDGDSAIALDDDNVTSEEHAPGIDGDILARMSVRSGMRIRPPQTSSEVNGSVGGEKGRAEQAEETEEMARMRLEGLRRAQQEEMVRSAARRGVAFGFVVGGTAKGTRRKCEAVMLGKVVEPSFAKGDWGIRWRE
ncbi:hypothetical protein DL762_008953 [Monosporascus cannonballus]|uniref:Uncharacterized protein n=1 Tax=Monosporascus cannonballus TaxID=155416 RepID=A0ABY0GVM9_9PEZI|nr:hypothetical protein DL762_008953 [Monosporascus cannonballus]RYO80097.1 hypothetical protein DL763_009032 [Monosporascus cannonballus]